MITRLPAVQKSCKRARRIAACDRQFKRIANRRHRRSLSLIERRLSRDAESFWSETFDAPSLSGWDIV